MKKSDLLARFDGPIVMIGFGSIGKGTLPLIERHLAFDRAKFVVIAPVGRKVRKECATSRPFKTARSRVPRIWAAIAAAADSLGVGAVSEAAAAGAVDLCFCHVCAR